MQPAIFDVKRWQSRSPNKVRCSYILWQAVSAEATFPGFLQKAPTIFPQSPGTSLQESSKRQGREPTRHGFINMSRCFRYYLVFPVLRAGPAIMRNVKATAISVPAVTGASASISRFPFGTSLRCQKTFLLNRLLCASRLPSLTMLWQRRRCGRATMSW